MHVVSIRVKVGCCCSSCSTKQKQDSLRLSRFRLDVNQARGSEAMLLLTEEDPLMKSFELASNYKELSFVEVEFREEYLELSKKLEKFSCQLISHARSSQEIEHIMEYSHPNRYCRLSVIKRVSTRTLCMITNYE